MMSARPSKPSSRIGGRATQNTMRSSARRMSITPATRRAYSSRHRGSLGPGYASPFGPRIPCESLPPKRMNATSGWWVSMSSASAAGQS